MKKHVKIYMEYFDYGIDDFIPCEITGQRANDIHHIDNRGMGGSENKDKIENLMALTREMHDKYGDKKQYREYLQKVHENFIKRHHKNKFK
jgi:hypothetical protein